MKRETGYYWVKRPDNDESGNAVDSEWEVALFSVLPDRNIWTIMWFDGEFKDDAFAEINETRILNPDGK